MVSDGPSCVGCGFCCSEIMCRIGTMIYGHYTKPCPALKQAGDRWVCSLYLGDPARYEQILDIGGGCCFSSNPLREELTNRR
jgi:hypothetical protein